MTQLDAATKAKADAFFDGDNAEDDANVEIQAFELPRPVKFKGKSFDKLTFGEPLVADLIAAEGFKTEAEKLVAILTAMCRTPGVTIQVLNRLPVRQFRRIERWASPFLGGESLEEAGATS